MAHISARAAKDGSKRYRALVRLKGHPAQSATFERKSDAKKWAQQTEAAIREGRYFSLVAAKRHSAQELIDRYVEEILPRKPKLIYEQSRQLQWWRKQFGRRTVADLTPDFVVHCRNQLGRETIRGGGVRSPGTINRYMAALSHVFTIAVREWAWIDTNPISRIPKLKEPRGRVRCLSDEERARLLATCRRSRSRLLYPIVVLALSTGMRRGEVVSLRWQDIDFSRKALVIHETKNDERRAIPLAGLALKLLQDLADDRNPDNPLVFPGRNGIAPIDIRTPWETALRDADIKDFRFHDLRHSAASYLAMNGASLAEIAAVLGHKSLQMVKRYTHLTDQHTAGVVASMNERIFGNEEA